METKPAIGIDLGATKIAAALVAPDGRVLASRQAPTRPERGEAAVLADIARLVDDLTLYAATDVLGVGIGSPGLVLPEKGTVNNAVNLGWKEVQLVEGVRSRLTRPLRVWIQKDVNASALGEHYFGAARGCNDFVVMTVGSGLGGGVFADGHLINGAVGNAAEIGHLSLDPQGWPCTCGLRGCAETIVSGRGLLAVTRHLIGRGQYPTRLTDSPALSTRDILEAAAQGDELAGRALRQVGETLGIVMAAACAFLNPVRIVLGGGLALAAFDELVSAARVELQRRIVPASFQSLDIVPSQLSSSAVGAACLAWYAQRF